MATPGALQPQIRDIVANGGMVPGGIIPFSETIFLWQSFVSVIVEMVVVTLVMWLATPPASKAKTAAALGINLGEQEFAPSPKPQVPSPGQWLEYSPILNMIVVALGAVYLVRYFGRAAEPLNAITVNIINFAFLLVGVLLHQTPARLMQAVQAATPAVWGVILQFPFYAGIAAIITSTHLSQQLANAFVSVSTPGKLSGGGGDLFGGARRVRAVRRIEVGDRSAVRDERGARAQGAPGLGGGRRTISARRSRTWCSRSGCCRSWGCSGCARAT